MKSLGNVSNNPKDSNLRKLGQPLAKFGKKNNRKSTEEFFELEFEAEYSKKEQLVVSHDSWYYIQPCYI